jgi:hypothetical protein
MAVGRIPLSLLLAGALVSVLLGLQPAYSHAPTSFTACATYKKSGGHCGNTATYTPYSFNTVHLRGRVKPVHSKYSAKVMRKKPYGVWKHAATVPIGARGKMRWAWRVNESHISQNKPWRLKFLIQGHGQSSVAKAWIIYGE